MSKVLEKVFSSLAVGRMRFIFRMKINQLASFLPRLRASERAVEYSWVMANLKPDKNSVLDVGCCDSFLSHELLVRGYNAYAIDIRDYRERPTHLNFVRADVRYVPFRNDSFNQVIAVSTIEHVGIGGRYGSVEHRDGDLQAVQEMDRILKKDDRVCRIAILYNRPMTRGWNATKAN